MSVSFTTAYLFSGELFPTVVRNIGVGTSSMCARIGSISAPFVVSLVSHGLSMTLLSGDDCRARVRQHVIKRLKEIFTLALYMFSLEEAFFSLRVFTCNYVTAFT